METFPPSTVAKDAPMAGEAEEDWGEFRRVMDIVYFEWLINRDKTFISRGFHETVNISLLALALSDLLSLLPMAWKTVSLILDLLDPELMPMVLIDVGYMTAAVPHGIFVRIAWWITNFITFERCLCVTWPLRVKHFITPARTVVILVVIFVFIVPGMSPLFVGSRLGYVFSGTRNKTLLARIFNDNVQYLEFIGFTFSVSAQFGSFFLDIFFTVIIVHQLLMKSKWRMKSTSVNTNDKLSIRDRKLVKMIVMISCVFIASLIPSFFSFIVELIYPMQYSLAAQNTNIFKGIWSVIFTIEMAQTRQLVDELMKDIFLNDVLPDKVLERCFT
ncbi:uncharacterized protein LOC131928034 [Physella acuta]|uniref:uncharacterized protein LOC131928034 n=1 Tax=Physella acuta TaxID=109671 RepID=UPI0027DC68F9|nr:uncharacterized protein LOC131928034 [Physella acuta]